MQAFDQRARSLPYSQLLERHLITSIVMNIHAKHFKESIPEHHFKDRVKNTSADQTRACQDIEVENRETC